MGFGRRAGHAEVWHQPYSVEPSNRLLDGLGEVVDHLFGGVGEPPAAGVGEGGACRRLTVLDLASARPATARAVPACNRP